MDAQSRRPWAQFNFSQGRQRTGTGSWSSERCDRQEQAAGMVMFRANQGGQRCPLGVGAAELLACSTLWALRGRRPRPHAQGETCCLAVADDGWIARWLSSSCALIPFLLFLLLASPSISAVLFFHLTASGACRRQSQIAFHSTWPK